MTHTWRKIRKARTVVEILLVLNELEADWSTLANSPHSKPLVQCLVLYSLNQDVFVVLFGGDGLCVFRR